MGRDLKLLALQSSSVFESTGGVEHYLDDLLQIAAGPPGTVCTLVPRRHPLPLEPLERPYKVVPIPLPTPKSMLNRLRNRYSYRLVRMAIHQIRKQRPNWLVCGHVSLGPTAQLIGRLTGVPVLSIVYGIESWGDLWPQDEWALRRAHGIISISHWTRDRLVRRGFSADKIRIVHPALDPRLIQACTRAVQATGPLRLLTVGRLSQDEQYKGHDDVLRALALLKKAHPALEFEYTIQGDGDDRKRLQEITRHHGLQESVCFEPQVSDRVELGKLYSQTDLFVMPSRFGRWDGRWRGEGFGIVYLEAAAHGVPSLAYDTGGVTDIFKDGKTARLVSPDDIQALANALRDLHADRGAVQRLGLAAQAHVRKHFTRAHSTDQLEAALEHFGQIKAQRSETSTRFQSPRSGEALPPA